MRPAAAMPFALLAEWREKASAGIACPSIPSNLYTVMAIDRLRAQIVVFITRCLPLVYAHVLCVVCFSCTLAFRLVAVRV